MSQIHKNSSQSEEQSSSLDNLRSRFDKIGEKDQVRVVTLKYKSCCGCGCNYEDVRRTVPGNSPLQDGDVTEKWVEGDEYV